MRRDGKDEMALPLAKWGLGGGDTSTAHSYGMVTKAGRQAVITMTPRSRLRRRDKLTRGRLSSSDRTVP